MMTEPIVLGSRAGRTSNAETLARIDERLTTFEANGHPLDEEPQDWRDESDNLPTPLDWHALYDRSIDDVDWLVEDFWPARRSIAIIARYKSGKSLLMFYICCCLARGIDPWTRGKREPITVGYWDYEMTEDDVHERALDFGLEPAELDRFKYYLLPNIPPLDTPEGGKAVLATVRRDGIQATVFDTYGRTVEGPENDVDTLNAYLRWTANHLKAEGIANARLDHVGHTEQTRARGSSGKGADIDVAWVAARGEGNNVRLDHGGVSRLRWVPRTLDLELVEGDPDIYQRVGGTWPAGTKELAALLESLGVPVEAGERPAGKALRGAGHKRVQALIRSAQKWRRHEADREFVGSVTNSNSCDGTIPSHPVARRTVAPSVAPVENHPSPAASHPPSQSVAPPGPYGVGETYLSTSHPQAGSTQEPQEIPNPFGDPT